MKLTTFTLAPSATVQVLDAFVGTFRLSWSGEVSLDGGATYITSPIIGETVKVCAPTTLWARNQSAGNQSFTLLTWN